MTDDNDISVVETRYGPLAYFNNDQGALRYSLESYGEWAQNEISFIEAFIKPGGVVVDVGAFIGTHSLPFSRLAGPEGVVIAIEAQPRTFALLERNISNNGAHNVRLVNAIAAADQGSRRLHDLDTGQAESFGSISLRDMFSREHGPENHIDPAGPLAQQITLDSLRLPTCDLIKIDAEGMEHIVLAGSRQILSALSPAVYAECNCLEDGLKTFRILVDYGYSVFAHIVRAFNPHNFKQSNVNIFSDACEVALVAVKDGALSYVQQYPVRHYELLLPIETADDLALALFNKPQYLVEILSACEAAKHGGSRILNTISEARLRVQELERDTDILRATVNLERSRNGVLQHEIDGLVQNVREGEERLASMGTHVRALMAEQDSFAARHVRDAQRLAAGEARRGEIELELQSVYRSSSWRLTAPLRALRRFVRTRH